MQHGCGSLGWRMNQPNCIQPEARSIQSGAAWPEDHFDMIDGHRNGVRHVLCTSVEYEERVWEFLQSTRERGLQYDATIRGEAAGALLQIKITMTHASLTAKSSVNNTRALNIDV